MSKAPGLISRRPQSTKSSEVSLEERFRRHEEASKRVKAAAQELGLRQVPDPKNAANGMTAVSFIFARFRRGSKLTSSL